MNGMQTSKTVFAAAFLIALPPLFALGLAGSFHASNRNNGAIVSGGVRREYLLHVPASYDGRSRVPLVISLHGAGGWPVQQMEVSGWNRVADREGFLVVYPAAADGGPRVWQPDRGQDARFIADLIDHIEQAYNVDRSRIYIDGLSNGGGMAFALSCTMSDRIAAVGLVASAQSLPWSWCTDARPVPMIAFHGTADPAVPYRGGPSWMSPGVFPDISTWATRWAQRNRCTSSMESNTAPDVSRREYANCADDATVVLYTVRGGGHTWPGGGAMPEWLVGRETHSIDATTLMWAFFRAHPLHGRAAGRQNTRWTPLQSATLN